jgi:cytochrome c553
MTRSQLLASLLATAALAASTAHAAGNVEQGRLLTYTCHGCHGVPGYTNAYPNYHVPRIGGQSREYLIAALNAYKNGDREHPTMRAQGESLSAQDIEDIAAYLAGLVQ